MLGDARAQIYDSLLARMLTQVESMCVNSISVACGDVERSCIIDVAVK